MIKHLDLFSGIGGFALATELAWGGSGVSHIFCDNEPFSQAILKKHWPNSKIYGDIKELKGKDIGKVDIVTGGFPCQPFSAAGKRKGTSDDRHLWPEMLRVIRETSPSWVIGENVGGLLTWNGGMVLDEVFSDLEAEGYEVWAFVIPACAVKAPHRRDRVWITAYSHKNAQSNVAVDEEMERGMDRSATYSDRSGGQRRGAKGRGRLCDQKERSEAWPEAKGCTCSATDTYGKGLKGYRKGRPCIKGWHRLSDREGNAKRSDLWRGDWTEVATRLCSVDDGLSGGLARPKGWRNAALKGAGNAIVPQVAAEIMKNIKI